MKRLILLLAVPILLVAAHAMGGSPDAVTEAATPCEECCPEVVCAEICADIHPEDCCVADCCPPDCCPLEAALGGCEDGCPGAAILSTVADTAARLADHVGSMAASLTKNP